MCLRGVLLGLCLRLYVDTHLGVRWSAMPCGGRGGGEGFALQRQEAGAEKSIGTSGVDHPRC